MAKIEKKALTLLETLEAMDARARDQGHTLAQVLEHAARVHFNINLHPLPPKED